MFLIYLSKILVKRLMPVMLKNVNDLGDLMSYFSFCLLVRYSFHQMVYFVFVKNC